MDAWGFDEHLRVPSAITSLLRLGYAGWSQSEAGSAYIGTASEDSWSNGEVYVTAKAPGAGDRFSVHNGESRVYSGTNAYMARDLFMWLAWGRKPTIPAAQRKIVPMNNDIAKTLIAGSHKIQLSLIVGKAETIQAEHFAGLAIRSPAIIVASTTSFSDAEPGRSVTILRPGEEDERILVRYLLP